MRKIIIVRHGESIGNARNIIQGRNNDYGLTEKGKEVTYSNVHTNLEIFKDATRIISSSSKRTLETADIISKELNLQVIENRHIEETDAGILSDMDKNVASCVYPHYYQIWKNRQDLDEIPSAESGEKLQARVLAFLMQYYDMTEYSDVVVSHAGFIRCLINTIENRERTFQFNIENSSFFSIDDVFSKLTIQKIERAMNSKVLIITTINGIYVAKIKKGRIREQDYAEQSLLNEMEGKNIPKILCIQDYDDKGYCKIIKYVKGKHTYGRLNNEEYNALIKSERELNSKLTTNKHNNYFRTNNLRKKIENIYQKAKTPYIREIAETLLTSKYWKTVEDEELYVLSHDDLNRDNILFEKMPEGKIRANIIDFESLERAPKDYQFASMLASGLLLEGESINKLKQTIQLQNMDFGKILFFMQIRILEGLYFFRENPNEYASSNEKVSKELLKKYFYSSEIIQKEVEKLRILEREEQEQ